MVLILQIAAGIILGGVVLELVYRTRKQFKFVSTRSLWELQLQTELLYAAHLKVPLLLSREEWESDPYTGIRAEQIQKLRKRTDDALHT